MVRPRSRSSFRGWAVVVLALVLTKARAGSPEPLPDRSSSDSSRVGRPLAVQVRGGRSSFDVSASGSDGPTLVIVSALAKARGPFPIGLVARSTGKPKSVELAPEVTTRLPRLDLPKLAPGPMPVSGLPPERRTFHLLARGGDVSVASNYLAVDGQLRAVGRWVQVYVDLQDRDIVEASTLRDLVTTFDESIFPEAAARFGPAIDVDRDGRFTVLFSSWLTRLAGGKVSVDGFVRGADLDSTLVEPFGNRCDMMYLSTSLKAGPHLRTIVAHEYTHAVTFSRKALARGGAGLEEEGWLDEALAHLVEDSHGFSTSNIDYRVSAFLSRPESYRLVVDDYYAADLFRSHGNRGATYLFLRWCVDRYGPGLVDLLVRSEFRGVASLEAATGATFADLFRRWTVALFLSGLDPASSPEGAYRSIDPRGELEEWVLAGPRASSVSAGQPSDSWLAEGTTTHYVLVDGFPPGAVSVEVTGPPEAEIQVTMVPLPSGLGRPKLKVRPQSSPEGEIRVRAEVSEQDGTPVRLGALTWEPLVPADDPRRSGFRRGGLDMLGIASVFGTSALPAHGKLRSRAFPIAGLRASDGPVVFKAVGTDARGRRVAAWTIVSPSSKRDDLAIEDVEDF
jgi:hypothetical protein